MEEAGRMEKGGSGIESGEEREINGNEKKKEKPAGAKEWAWCV